MRFRYVLWPVKAILILAVFGVVYAWCGIMISSGRKNIGTMIYFMGWMLAGDESVAVRNTKSGFKENIGYRSPVLPFVRDLRVLLFLNLLY